VKPIVYGNVARYFGKKREEDGHTHQWTVYVKPYRNEVGPHPGHRRGTGAWKSRGLRGGREAGARPQRERRGTGLLCAWPGVSGPGEGWGAFAGAKRRQTPPGGAGPAAAAAAPAGGVRRSCAGWTGEQWFGVRRRSSEITAFLPQDMSAYVKKIQFKLHESYGNPLRGEFCAWALARGAGIRISSTEALPPVLTLLCFPLQSLPNHRMKSPKRAGVNSK